MGRFKTTATNYIQPDIVFSRFPDQKKTEIYPCEL